MVAALLFPLCGVLIALAGPLLAFVFTSRFSAAVLPFRIYVTGLLSVALETTTLALALGASAPRAAPRRNPASVGRGGNVMSGASATRDPTLGLCGIAIGANGGRMAVPDLEPGIRPARARARLGGVPGVA